MGVAGGGWVGGGKRGRRTWTEDIWEVRWAGLGSGGRGRGNVKRGSHVLGWCDIC